MRTISAVLTTLVLLLGAGLAAAQTVERIDILQAGLYTAAVTGTAPAPGTTTGRTQLLGDIQFYQKTDRVPATIGTRFGVNYLVVGAPEGAMVELRQV